MPRRRKPPVIVGAVLAGLLVVCFCALVALLGGFLNHCRGGYVHFGPKSMEKGSHLYNEWYWPQHILGRLLFALPTGLLVIVFGLHVRGSLVVSMMTWFSLYIGWGTYMNIGMDDNYCSRAGTFDWLIGRQAQNMSINNRFVREYSGMSLRGLMWTLPQGYALEQMGFGWEYSLTGSVMPLIYYIGANTNTTHVHGHRMQELMNGSLAISELMWGMWVWFALIIACLSQAVRRARIWIYKRSPLLGFKPFSAFEKVKYESMNRPVLRGFYDVFVTVLTIVYCFTVCFYSLVVQSDVRNKGQTFFGLFTGVLFLVFSQAWIWGMRYKIFLQKRYARKLRGRTLTNNAMYNGGIQSAKGEDGPELSRTTSLASNMDQCEALSNTINSSMVPPAGSPRRPRGWPYSHPDRLSPTEEQRQQVLDLSEHLQVGSSRPTFIAVWTMLEKYVWMDVFVFARRTIGIVTLVCTIFSILITITATIIGWDKPRFRQDLEPPCSLSEFL